MRNASLLLAIAGFGFAAVALGQSISEKPNHDARPPAISEYMPQPAILVFSKTEDWRHNEGIAGADRFFTELAHEKGMGLFTTENGAVFNAEQLALFDVVIFNNMTGDALSPEQEDAFQSWLKDGKGWIGIHGSGDNSHKDWEWYDRGIIGPEFIGHPADPQFQDAEVVKLATNHPITTDLPDRWIQNDEWYSFEDMEFLQGSTPLFGLDEGTYSPQNLVYGDREDLRMGPKPEDHPIVWTRCLNGARTFYSAIGHLHTAYDNTHNRALLTNAFDWVRNTAKTEQGC
ncbi:ThuA domain-containing protein [Pontixanthobacter sp. CEM42]|uniref:ThuA domain-containing protein n=1 Tax=Pontixanthobacter sp. CEM42 TaxID=2792077 RepID=UPI001ADFA612|nr:ThuA domain-containing protein [Pontixanthobacter sp. CEM42]